jgi:hypothetical protein
MAGRLANILKEEYKTKGLVGGLASAGGKRLKEMFDIRNVLFSGGGIGSQIGKKIFGKGYSATADRDKSESISNRIQPPQQMFSQESVEILSSIKNDTRISAKNSVVLPQIARDANLTKLNIMKLVKLQGDTATMRADMFFKRAGAREESYESQFKKGSKTSPQPVTKNDESKSLLQILFSGIKSLGSLITGALSSLGGIISGALGALGTLLLGKKLTDSVPIPGVDGKGGKGGKGGKVAGLGIGGAVMGAGIFAGLSVGAGYATDAIMDKTGLSVSPEDLEKAKLKDDENWKKMSIGEKVESSIARGFEKLGSALTLDRLSEKAMVERVNNESSYLEKKSPTPITTQDMANLIRTKFKAAGFSDAQAEGAVANAMAESSLNPNAFNGKDGEESVGLFQMNRKGGLGVGHSIENLKDPNYNIDLAIAAAKNAKRFKAATTPEEATKAFMLEVERPRDQSTTAQAKRVALLNNTGENLNSGSVAIASRPTSAPSTPSPIVNVDNSRTQMASGSSGAQVSAWDNLMFENMITRVI